MNKCRETVEATSFSLRPLVLIEDDDFHHAALSHWHPRLCCTTWLLMQEVTE